MLLTLLNAALLSASSSSKFKVDWDSLFERLTDWSIEIGKSILGAILIYIIGRFIIKQINRLVSKILERTDLPEKPAEPAAEPDSGLRHHRQTGSGDHQLRSHPGFCRCGHRYGPVR